MTDIPILNALIFAVAGLAVFAIAASMMARLAPFDLWKAVVEDRNVAVAILAGAVALGIAWIVAATVH
jgi:uncharacterized membrane protein YjfL (UPF0719 family)